SIPAVPLSARLGWNDREEPADAEPHRTADTVTLWSPVVATNWNKFKQRTECSSPPHRPPGKRTAATAVLGAGADPEPARVGARVAGRVGGRIGSVWYLITHALGPLI